MTLASLGINAQDAKAESILKDLSTKAKSYNTIKASFVSLMEDKQADLNVEQKGDVIIQGEKFVLDLDKNFELISDGATLWTYSKEGNEVMIDNVEDVYDEEGIKPSEIFTVWEKDFQKYYDSESSVNGKKVDVLKLTPTNPRDKSYHTVKVFIDREKTELVKVIIYGKEGNNITYSINSFQSNVDIASNTFSFNRSKYPGVELIDNR